MKIKSILFPTDFSEGSFHALPYAADFAKTYNAKLYILHTIYDVIKATDSHIPHISTDELYKELNEWAMKEIDTCCIEEVRGLSGVEKVVIKGIPYEEIIKFATEKEVDIIVMGTYGREEFERFIFGSTVEKVVRRAPCPVMTVRVPHGKK
jgi:nucleotide-binding universal stress UspA family protein